MLHAAAAEFVGDELDTCVDATLGLRPDVGAGDRAQMQGELEAGVLRRLKHPTKLSSTCAQRFGDHPVFGTCVMKSASTHQIVVGHRYRFSAVFDGDAAKNECTAAQGNWHALPRESAEILKGQAQRAPKDAGRGAELARRPPNP